MAEGQRGGQFFTPTSIVKLMVEIIEPFNGRIFDPACGSGGMFVQSAHFTRFAITSAMQRTTFPSGARRSWMRLHTSAV